MKIKFTLDKGAKAPTRAHDTDTGYDIYAMLDSGYEIKSGDGVGVSQELWFDTGLHVQPESGYWVEVVPNSRIAKTCFSFANSVGIIDAGFTNSIRVILRQNRVRSEKDNEYIDKILKQEIPCGQLILRKRYDCEWEQVDKLDETERGNGGFGSSEKKKQDTKARFQHPKVKGVFLHVDKRYGKAYYSVRMEAKNVYFRFYVKAELPHAYEAIVEFNEMMRKQVSGIMQERRKCTHEELKTKIKSLRAELLEISNGIGVIQWYENKQGSQA